MARLKLGILISGRGTNMMSIIDACKDEDFPAEVVLVISNRPGAAGLEKAEAAGIKALAIDHKAYEGREAFEEAMTAALEAEGVELVVNAGFMRIVTETFVNHWLGRNINIHPSLLPSFPGIHVHEQALKAGVKISGCTVHFVTAELDGGPIIGQAAVPVMEDDTPDTLAARILVEEHTLYPLCVRMIAEGKVTYDNGRAVFVD
ncbi:MAG: phosphoribosylglycinamide formyltransferase [Alphaproteobacteria bacterium]|nr:MAG: phosphoribosylglycinamide formyltransferase [Alphaproteobacteria bacterium]